MTRRRHQTGCLFQRGKRRKLWVARWREDVIAADGQLKRVNRSIVLGAVADYRNKRDIYPVLEAKLRPLNAGILMPGTVKRFADFAEGEWMKLVFPTYTLPTQNGYRRTLQKHVLPAFGDKRLGAITKADVQQFIAARFAAGKAWNTVRNAWIVVSTVLDAAVEYGHLLSNPARGVRFPPKPQPKQRRMLSPQEFAGLVEAIDEPFRTLLRVNATLGLRIGEGLALRWKSVDFERQTLLVIESVCDRQFQPPKYGSVRKLSIPPGLQMVLKAHRERSFWRGPDDLVFSEQRGVPYREQHVLKVLQRAAKKAGLGHLTWHDLRHGVSTRLHHLRHAGKTIQTIMGHARLETTMNIYTHGIPEAEVEAITALERELFPDCSQVGGNGKEDKS